MSNENLKRTPHQTKDERVWWYEEPRGITIVIEFWECSSDTKDTQQIYIPWGALRRAVARKDQ